MDISAGIVLYNPDTDRLKENINAIINQCTHIYLIDNGSDNINNISDLLEEYNDLKITVIYNQKNMGIASALNQLTEAAKKDNFNWILTLDQDSVSPLNIIKEFKKYTNKNNVGMLCPVICDRNKDKIIKAEEGYIEVKECITSGSLLNINAWDEIGGFDDNMFIDGVDFDICYRLRQASYRILCVQSVVLLHELGHIEYHRFLFWKVIVKNHSAFRKYYIARNIIYIARKRKSLFLIFKGILQEIKVIGIAILYESDKFNKINRIFAGICDGFRCKVGK